MITAEKLKHPKYIEILTRTHLDTEDLICENLLRLKKQLPDRKRGGDSVTNEERIELGGLALVLGVYKIKNLYGRRYFEGRDVDNFVEMRYVSNILKGISKTLERKTTGELTAILYNSFTNVLKGSNTLSEKEMLRLDPTKKMYNSIAKRLYKRDEEEIRNRVKEIGLVLDGMRECKMGMLVKEELLQHSHLKNDEARLQMTRIVAQKIMVEEKTLRLDLAEKLTDKFK